MFSPQEFQVRIEFTSLYLCISAANHECSWYESILYGNFKVHKKKNLHPNTPVSLWWNLHSSGMYFPNTFDLWILKVHEKHLTDLDEEHRQKNGEEEVSSSMKSGEIATGATGNSTNVNNDGRKSDSKMNTPKKKYLSVQGALDNNSPVVKSLFHSEEKDDDLENKLLQPTARVRGELDLESPVI